jgi:ribonuclease P protein component
VVQFRFSKALRLLTPADFKQVFDRAELRVSSKELLILARINCFDHPRLGLVIAKKHVRRAVQRNRIKRVIRERFRQQQAALLGTRGIDTIVLARGGIDKLDNAALQHLLDGLWHQLQRKAQKQSLASATDRE